MKTSIQQHISCITNNLEQLGLYCTKQEKSMGLIIHHYSGELVKKLCLGFYDDTDMQSHKKSITTSIMNIETRIKQKGAGRKIVEAIISSTPSLREDISYRYRAVYVVSRAEKFRSKMGFTPQGENDVWVYNPEHTYNQE